MFAETAQTMATLDRPPVYFRTLMQALTMLDPIQFRKISAREMAECCKISQISAERALAMLEADNVVIAKGKASAKARRINNRLAWSSSSEKWNSTPADPEVIDGRGR